MKKLIKNKIFMISLITLVLLILMGISYENKGSTSWFTSIFNMVSTPLQSVSTTSSNKSGSFFYYFKDMDGLIKENERLKKQIDEMNEQNRKLNVYKEQNVELAKAVKLKDSYPDYDIIASNVIAKDMGNWFELFKIDVGKKDGVQNDQTVRTSKGLVGRIETADLTSSKVITIIDPGCTVSAKLSKNGSYVIIKGELELKNKGFCIMENIDPDSDIGVGDEIETSGLGGIYPKGILIGKVKEIRKAGNDFSKSAVIEPCIDFKKLDQVVVMKRK